MHVLTLRGHEPSEARWRAVEKAFPEAALRPIRCDAVDGRDWERHVPRGRFPVYNARFKRIGQKGWDSEPMSEYPGAIGCLLAHGRLWNAIARGSEEVAVVTEDDAIPTSALAGRYISAIAGLIAADGRPMLVNLWSDAGRTSPGSAEDGPVFKPAGFRIPDWTGLVLRDGRSTWHGAVAYVLNRAAALALSDFFKAPKEDYFAPSDVFIMQAAQAEKIMSLVAYFPSASGPRFIFGHDPPGGSVICEVNAEKEK